MINKRPYLGRSVIRRSTTDWRVLHRIAAARHDPPLVMDDQPAARVFARLLERRAFRELVRYLSDEQRKE